MSNDIPHVAVITGGAQGIGLAVAQRLALSGTAVAIADVQGARAEEAVHDLAGGRDNSLALEVDVTDERDMVRLADEVEAKLGPIEAWVNNAGLTRPAMLDKMEADDFDLVVRVHVRGTFLGIREAAKRMIASTVRGSIVNVTSSAGLNGTIGQINYSAAKGAIIAMTKSAARELGRYGIRVNAVAPIAATEMTVKIRTDPKLSERYLAGMPLGRWAETDEIVDTFSFLTSSSASYITGQVICVDGGTYMVN